MQISNLSKGFSRNIFFVTIMRGATICVPIASCLYVRGRERSRDPFSIEEEVKDLLPKGFVRWLCWGKMSILIFGNRTIIRTRVVFVGSGWPVWLDTWRRTGAGNFCSVVERVAAISPLLRVRYTTSHPKDMQDDVLYAMAAHPNICKHIHLPVQSGSNSMLKKMNRDIHGKNTWTESQPYAAFCRDVPFFWHDQRILFGNRGRSFTNLFRWWKGPFWSGFYVPLFPETEYTGSKALQGRRPWRGKNQAPEWDHCITKPFVTGKQPGRCGKSVWSVGIEGLSKRSDEFFFGRTGTNKACVFPKWTAGGWLCKCSRKFLHGSHIKRWNYRNPINNWHELINLQYRTYEQSLNEENQ